MNAANQQPNLTPKNLIIYSITNKTNGKKYVGQSRQGIARRKAEHIYRFNSRERDHKLYQSMRKHGLENFEFEVLCHCLKPEYLDELEKHFIAEFNSFNRGYNMTCGGDSISDETREKIRAAMKGRKITWYDKIVASRIANPNRKKAKDFVARGAANVNSKSYLIKFPDGHEERIKGLNQFCKDNGLNNSSMSHTLSGKDKSHKGYTVLERFID